MPVRGVSIAGGLLFDGAIRLDLVVESLLAIFDALLGPLLLLGVRALAVGIFVVVSVALIPWRIGRRVHGWHPLVLQNEICRVIEFGIGLPVVEVTTSIGRRSSLSVPLPLCVLLFGIL